MCRLVTMWPWSPLLVMLGLLLHVYLAQAGFEHTCYLADQAPHPKGICGRRVPSTLSQVCQLLGRGYASRGMVNKRTDVIDTVSAGSEEEAGGLRSLLLTKREALSYLQQQQQHKPLVASVRLSHMLHKRVQAQGITCECCYNQCSLRELLQYCH